LSQKPAVASSALALATMNVLIWAEGVVAPR
jgi:hypothetical protein